MTKRLPSLAVVLLATAGISAPAQAATSNLLTNGSFESSLSGWICVAEYCGSVYNPGAVDPVREAHMWNNSGVGRLYQDISTIAGQLYDVSFWWRDVGNNPVSNRFAYSLDGGPEVQLGNPATDLFHSTSFTAGGSTARIEFLFETDSGTSYWALDDVRVSASDAGAAAVPLPASALLLGGALAGLGGLMRRRRRA
jgi:hypothetical protein